MLVIFPLTLESFLCLIIFYVELFFKIYIVQLLLFFFFLFLIFINIVEQLCIALMIDNNHWPIYLKWFFSWMIFIFLPTTHGYMHLNFIEPYILNIIILQSLRYQLNFGLLVPLWPWHSWIWNWIWIKVCSFLIYQ